MSESALGYVIKLDKKRRDAVRASRIKELEDILRLPPPEQPYALENYLLMQITALKELYFESQREEP